MFYFTDCLLILYYFLYCLRISGSGNSSSLVAVTATLGALNLILIVASVFLFLRHKKIIPSIKSGKMCAHSSCKLNLVVAGLMAVSSRYE